MLIDTYNLDAYFRDKVIAGPGAFVVVARDYRDFARAFLIKLRRELSTFIGERQAPGQPCCQTAGKKARALSSD